MILPSGRHLGGRADRPDPRDKRFEFTHMARASVLPRKVDLRAKLPPAFDQGQEGSCGANAGSALMCFLRGVTTSYARNQIYYAIRQLEGDVSVDGGVETRDVLKILQTVGTYPEVLWPYSPATMFAPPPTEPPADYDKLSSYSRLVTETEYLACLAGGFPFLLGFECFESIDSDALAQTGVMPRPDPTKEEQVGGHDVLICGYDLDFKTNPDLLASKVNPALVDDEAILVRNSWGEKWGLEGYFWMPISYAVNPSIGGDAWTGRL